MSIVVSDNSVFVHLANARLMERAFVLPHEFVVADVMFADELLDLGSYTREGLLKAGLRVRGLDSDGVALAFRYAERYKALANNDAFALALAKTVGSLLIADDATLCHAATEEDVGLRDRLWLTNEMQNFMCVSAWEDDHVIQPP